MSRLFETCSSNRSRKRLFGEFGGTFAKVSFFAAGSVALNAVLRGKAVTCSLVRSGLTLLTVKIVSDRRDTRAAGRSSETGTREGRASSSFCYAVALC